MSNIQEKKIAITKFLSNTLISPQLLYPASYFQKFKVPNQLVDIALAISTNKPCTVLVATFNSVTDCRSFL